MRFRIPTKILTLTICAAFLAPAAQGQDLILEEVFVTAQKREQTLEDVPLAVSTVSGETVNDYIGGAYDIRALAARVPGLNIETSNGRTQPRFYLRGLGNIDFDVNANQPVAMVFDEIYLENNTLRSVPLFDLERVEVLKGPQGSLFGRNTNAGAIAITSVRPGEDRNAHIKLGYGSRNTFNLEGASNFIRSDTFSIRAAFKYQERGEWIDNVWNGPGDDFGGFEETAWRFQFAWDPSDSFSALLKLHGFHQEGSDPNVFYANAIASGDSGVRAGFNPRVANHDSEVAMMQTDHVGLALNMQWEMDNGKTFTSVTGYDEVDNFQSADVDGGELSFNPAQIGDPGIQHWFSVATGDGLIDHSQFTQEFRLAGDSEGFFYQVGFYYFDEDFDLLNYDYLTPALSALVTQATESYALFGQSEFQLSDQLAFTVGARWTDDSKDLAVGPYMPGGFVFPDTISVSDDFFDWDLALSYDKSEDWTWYGRIATGARGPVTLARFGFTSKAKTETTESYEVGFKSTLADGRARWNSAFYMFQNDDHQLVATGGVGNTNQLLNARQVNGMGFETELDLLVSENLLIPRTSATTTPRSTIRNCATTCAARHRRAPRSIRSSARGSVPSARSPRCRSTGIRCRARLNGSSIS
ncbi:MAG: TonB-dependent receptor [Xanthomonadales bacterium]|nr:TonB-dependent receptor [Xanthomonadales bacterium]NIX14268.1 TonB-dependent receptor [Xanthomonadales bacterium]